MTTIKTILAAATLSTVLSFAAQAGHGVKPLQGVSFHAGDKHAVGYFLKEDNACNLVLTLAEGDAAPSRIETAIAAGSSTAYQFTAGRSLEFACQAEAKSMSISEHEATAAN